ncbi:hypothetical protein TrLO_g11596 [Triparma laevis f. longispina]|uniref:PH domain-containing protein n=1 Tax=Triparma laevis f. longispina TaxID=1714387 RepID=A0A9W7CDI2_9STRA|nr:hypothetical protein TrLO_g11596 [Triparma laevis f. longispina]
MDEPIAQPPDTPEPPHPGPLSDKAARKQAPAPLPAPSMSFGDTMITTIYDNELPPTTPSLPSNTSSPPSASSMPQSPSTIASSSFRTTESISSHPASAHSIRSRSRSSHSSFRKMPDNEDDEALGGTLGDGDKKPSPVFPKQPSLTPSPKSSSKNSSPLRRLSSAISRFSGPRVGTRPRLDSIDSKGSSRTPRTPLISLLKWTRKSRRNFPSSQECTTSSALISGWLSKARRSQSTTNLQSYSSAQTSWQRRWFCTYSSYLLYYASPSSPKILAALDLSVVGEICRFRNDHTGKTFVILVGETPYPLKADSAEMASDWIIMLNRIKDAKLLATSNLPEDNGYKSDSSASRQRSHAFRADDDEVSVAHSSFSSTRTEDRGPVGKLPTSPTRQRSNTFDESIVKRAPKTPEVGIVVAQIEEGKRGDAEEDGETVWMKPKSRPYLRLQKFKARLSNAFVFVVKTMTPIKPCRPSFSRRPSTAGHRKAKSWSANAHTRVDTNSNERQLAKIVERHLQESKEARREVDLIEEEEFLRKIENESSGGGGSSSSSNEDVLDVKTISHADASSTRGSHLGRVKENSESFFYGDV